MNKTDISPLNKLPFLNKFAYGIGAVPYGIKDGGFSYFILIYYSQVLGMPAQYVGLALFIAMLFDAVSDPLIGYWSDNIHHKWGRRHPFMYVSALPISISYYFIWVPPSGLSHEALFVWLTILAISIRTLITLYEVPSSALSAEMTNNYDERTSILSFRQSFAWIGGTVVGAIGLALFLVPTDTIERGIMNINGYHNFGMLAAFAIFISIMIGSLGTHKMIPYLRVAPQKTNMTLKRLLSEMFETLYDKNFIAIFLTTLVGATATGVGAGLNYYINIFYWQFNTEQVALLQVSVILSALLALFLGPYVSRKLGKKRAAIILGIIAFTTTPLPVGLRLLGLMPVNGEALLFHIIFIVTVLDLTFIICFLTLSSSMVADVVEARELQTKRRSEGVLFATIAFARKFSQGSGVMLASLLLAFIQFPTQLSPNEVADGMIYNLGIIYAPTLFIIWMFMLYMLSRYKIDRKRHEENLQNLAIKI